jgi:ribonuclease HII
MALAESAERVARAAKVPAPVATFRRERKLFREGFQRIAGVDEAGRGPLAGPVVAAAVVLNPKKIPRGIADSKVMTAAHREEVFAALMKTADVAFAFGSVAVIDRINILRASLQAMRRAVLCLASPPDAILVDGRDLPPGISMKAEAIIDGDALSLSIAAASIVAKVMRDRLMTRCDAAFAGYGLASHKGYSTKMHQEALTELGPCRLHRRSFWRVAAFYDEQIALPLVEIGEPVATLGDAGQPSPGKFIPAAEI